jgi:hypothetical protein
VVSGGEVEKFILDSPESVLAPDSELANSKRRYAPEPEAKHIHAMTFNAQAPVVITQGVLDIDPI